MSFTEKLDKEALEFFNEVSSRPFSGQAMAFLNAYWPEVHEEAEFIFSVAWDKMKYADMHAKGISNIFAYDEGCDLDFDIGLYFYELMSKFCDAEGPNAATYVEPYPMSQPEMMTSISRKKELREKVDVNFDGRVGFLEYLLFQYKDVANPADFCVRSMNQGDEHAEIRAARLALEEVNKAIRAYENEKLRLTTEAAKPGVRGLKAVNMLAQLDSSPLAESLNVALIKAEAALRKATKLYGGMGGGGGDGGVSQGDSIGYLWWMERDLAEKKAHYGGAAGTSKYTRKGDRGGLMNSIQAGKSLKKTTTVDKSAPATSGATLKKNKRGDLFGDIQKGKGLKKAETNDRSAPKTGGAKVGKSTNRPNMLAELLARDDAAQQD